jgi:membrane protein implicated in regulation of membrane protease activity
LFLALVVDDDLLAIGVSLRTFLLFVGEGELAAAAAAIVALFAGGIASVIVFIVASLLSLAVLRPIARSHIRMPALARTGTDALVGRRAVVTRRVDSVGGRVRIGGEEWSARSYLDNEVYAEGTTVDVVRIEGATALVAE